MKEQVLSIEQMNNLNKLGLATNVEASMCWVKMPSPNDGMEYSLVVHNEFCYEMSCLSPVPTFTLQDLIEILPSDVFGNYNFWLMKSNSGYKFSVKNNPDSAKIGTHFYDSPLEALYDILCWYLKNK